MPSETEHNTTELKRRLKEAEKTRREIEEKYRLLSENTQDVVSILDTKLAYTYISPSVKHTRGFEPEELVGRNLSSMITPGSFEKTKRLFSRKEIEKEGESGNGRSRLIELEMYKKDGATIWSESRVFLLRDENGRHTGYMNISRDIDEKKKIYEQLRESEEKFRSLAEACPYGILIYQDGHWVYTNPAGEEISGYPAEDLYRMQFWEIVHPDHRQMVKDRGLKRQEGEKVEPTSYDLKILGKDGSDRWISLTAANCLYRGRPAGMITVCDITVQREKEEALRESEEKYRAILDNIEEGYYEVDLHGNFTFFNEHICRIAACPCEEIWGVNYQEYTSPEDAKRLFRKFRRIYGTGRPAKAFDLQIYRPDGESRHVEISASLVRDHSRNPAGFRGIMRDITDRKKAEVEKEKLEAQLMHAHKMEAVGTLAGGVAHDFNNILQAINGYTQLLLLNRSKDDPDYDKLIQLEKAGERASALIQQLLTFSRNVAGERRRIDLNREIASVKKLLEQTLPKMIEIKLDLDQHLWFVNADPMYMEQILLNLASNAADAMPDGGRLTIETRNVVLDESYCSNHFELVPGNYALLTVSDTGCGMDPDTVCHIFDPFYTTKAVGKGTGLGLASVYGIVKEHGGLIHCYSEIGQGAVFKIYIPAAARIEESVEKEDGALVTAPMGGKESILVIDDESTVREMAREMLEYYGYQVLCAENGECALDIFRNNMSEIDLVILDLNMPGMGGYKCMQKLLDVNPEVRILIASGYATDYHAKQALSSGAASFIGKPYHLKEMARKVRSALDDRQ